MSVRRLLLGTVGGLAILAGVGLVIEERPVASVPPSSPSSATASVSGPPTATAPPRIPAGYRVQIPRLAIDLPIEEGDIQRDTVVHDTPESFAFHLPGTAIPASGSNCYLYAHARRGMFLSLWNAKEGDEVFISTPDGRALRYLVREVHPRVPPDDVSWIQPTPSERLTLQTSTGPNQTDPRFVVVATPG
jgi:LPXTG-site transpeptidase (sortase) family protein